MCPVKRNQRKTVEKECNAKVENRIKVVVKFSRTQREGERKKLQAKEKDAVHIREKGIDFAPNRKNISKGGKERREKREEMCIGG